MPQAPRVAGKGDETCALGGRPSPVLSVCLLYHVVRSTSPSSLSVAAPLDEAEDVLGGAEVPGSAGVPLTPGQRRGRLVASRTALGPAWSCCRDAGGKIGPVQGTSWRSSGWDLVLSLPGAQAQSLVGKLRSQKSPGVARKNTRGP